jgi:hypothetical protein
MVVSDDACPGDEKCESEKWGVCSYYFDDNFEDLPEEFVPEKGCYLILQDWVEKGTVSLDLYYLSD